MLTTVFGRTPEPWLVFDPTRTRPATGRAAAATANPLASWAALAMLRQGGSAVDAASDMNSSAAMIHWQSQESQHLNEPAHLPTTAQIRGI